MAEQREGEGEQVASRMKGRRKLGEDWAVKNADEVVRRREKGAQDILEMRSSEGSTREGRGNVQYWIYEKGLEEGGTIGTREHGP